MSKQISRAESWEQLHTAFQNINFAAFDYNSIKQSLVEYFKTTSPEFNNFIESDEFIMYIEALAYICELYSYRLDVTAHENLMPVAQRKDSILKLAKFISYSASRNMPARGLVKITSIKTSENILDSRGVNLANTKIIWNDLTNPYWKEQFILVMNHVLTNEFGVVLPTNRVQVYDQLFELYTLNNIPLTGTVIPYSIQVNGDNIPMELVPASLNNNGPFERRPSRNSPFTIIYGTDGIGDGSSNTGFFIFTKQGRLSSKRTTFDGITPNQTYDINVNNINNIDVWVNNIDNSGNIIKPSATNPASGEWVVVNNTYAENIIFNTEKNRNKFEIETLDNDNVRIIFGDGEFANIPSGVFDLWYRTSVNADITIPISAIYELESNLSYVDLSNLNQTLTFTFSSIQAISNSAASEDIEHIRNMAPSVYYTQDRMVTNQDYNFYLLQDQSILKLHSVNRSFAGQSKYMHWYDASTTYENVKIFGDDLSLYYKDTIKQIPNIPTNTSATLLVQTYIEPLLSDINVYLYRHRKNLISNARRYFTEYEKHDIIYNFLGELYSIDDITPFDPVYPIRIKYEFNTEYNTYLWTPYYTTQESDDWIFFIDKVFDNGVYEWVVKYKITNIIAGSKSTKFWSNNTASVINYDTITTSTDAITILKINTGSYRTKQASNILNSNIKLLLSGAVTYDEQISLNGTINYNAVTLITSDDNKDGWPDNIELSELINNTITINNTDTFPKIIELGYSCFANDIYIANNATGVVYSTNVNNGLCDTITVNTIGINTSVNIIVPDFVYFNRKDTASPWEVIEGSSAELIEYQLDTNNVYYKRAPGRSGLNFLWTHFSPLHQLVDPNTTNIIDMFILTKSYYAQTKQWLEGKLSYPPIPPTANELSLSYSKLLNSKMISDSVVLHSGKLKIIFGENAIPQLQSYFSVVKNKTASISDNQLKTLIVLSIKDYFDINDWGFGDMFNFTELAAKVHYDLQTYIDTIVLVPRFEDHYFGDLFQINVQEDEILIPDITVNDITIVSELTYININQHLYSR
jgi:hypothetical protein